MMTKVDLITGFLGAGKTTFLLRYAAFLKQQGQRIGILVFDHGALNIDMTILGELRAENCELEMLTCTWDADCRRRRLRTKLIAMGMNGYDRVIIEPSGVFDMDEFFDVLQDPPLDRWYEPGSVIAVVSAVPEPEATPEEDYYLASQAANAGCILMSRVQIATEGEKEQSLAHLERALKMIRCLPPEEERILAKNWNDLEEGDFRRLMNCGCRVADYVKSIAGRADGFQSLPFLGLSLSGEELKEKTEILFHNRKYGQILRVKGFYSENGNWIELNATASGICTAPAREKRASLLVIGRELKEEEIHILLTGRRPVLHMLDAQL